MHSHVHRQPLMYLFILRKNSILFNKPQLSLKTWGNQLKTLSLAHETETSKIS